MSGLSWMVPHGRNFLGAASPHLCCQEPPPQTLGRPGGDDEEAGATVGMVTANLPVHLHSDRR